MVQTWHEFTPLVDVPIKDDRGDLTQTIDCLWYPSSWHLQHEADGLLDLNAGNKSSDTPRDENGESFTKRNASFFGACLECQT
jgi:hypothetical protein